MELLCEKYKAVCFADIKGQDIAIIRLERFVKNFPEKKSLILVGPPGTGKTALAYSLAQEFNSEILELNASDFRNRENIEKIIGQASQQKSLSGKGKILLVDEVDGISTDDRGGLQELTRLIETTNFPIIITANDIWDKKFYNLRKSSELVELKELNYKIIFNIIKSIAEKENLSLPDDLLTSLSIKAKGDVRAAINDLQTITLETQHYDISERDKEEKIFPALQKIFKNLPNSETINLYDKLNMPLDDIYLWLEENIPLEYKDEELAKAYDSLSKADVFRGRIHRQQHWRFLIYQNLLLSAGVSSAKTQAKLGFTMYKKPGRILKIWMINQKNALKKSIAIKYSKFCHVGRKRAMNEFPTFKSILQNSEAQKQLKLSEEEIEFLKN